ncbi:polysaccharide biosynthesis protein [Candidatus Woesearchaeota archaeon]|nr:polysaccharide biosynthesis protein [Candidatus Woesearchaeota archaeon]
MRDDLFVKTFKGKDILITGGCGSIGSEIVKQLIQFQPRRIRVFDNNESGLFELQQKLQSPLIRTLVGDIRDKERLRFAVRGVDIVFHAAALKHVPLCEYNPFEAVKTNVIGTQNLIETCRENLVEKFIAISTDKAVNPINTMGATKLLSEKLVMTANIGINCKTKFSCVRFGNVLNSIGSVIPIFKQQIKRGGPVTITDENMVRFFMSMSEAVNLVLEAATLSKGGDIFILKMKRLKITDLADVVIKKMAHKYGHDPRSIKIKITGIRPGEKLEEQLITEEEFSQLINVKKMWIIRPHRILPYAHKYYEKMPLKFGSKEINEEVILDKKELETLLEKYDPQI